MDYSRVTPKARNGTTGICNEFELDATEGPIGCWINPPDRVAAITCAVHKQRDYDGDVMYKVECCCNSPSVIGEDGGGGYWDVVDSKRELYTDDSVTMIANSITGLRVTCFRGKINVCFVG